MRVNNIALLFFLVALFLLSCSNKSEQEQRTDISKDTLQNATPDTASVMRTFINTPNQQDSSITEIDSEIATYHLVIADTGHQYYALQHKMLALHKALNYPIDSMGRYYDEAKNLIVPPEDDEDEIYRGEYFPRRFPSENLSLEYLNVYKNDAKETSIALVAGIYESKIKADSALAVIKEKESKAFALESKVFIGCMH